MITLNDLTELIQSGWTNEFYLSKTEAYALNYGSLVVFPKEPLHNQLTALVNTWQRTETQDGGVITYTKASKHDET